MLFSNCPFFILRLIELQIMAFPSFRKIQDSWEFYPSQSEAEKLAGSDEKEGKCLEQKE